MQIKQSPKACERERKQVPFKKIIIFSCYFTLWLPDGSDGKESACKAGLSSVPGSGKSPREGNGNPLQYSCLENIMDRGAWWAKSMGSQRDTTE